MFSLEKKSPLYIIVIVALILPVFIYFWPQLTLKTATKIATTSASNTFPFCTDHNPDTWHASVEKDARGKIICVYGHEHGDAPPTWVTHAEHNVGFDPITGFLANTSALENSVKHAGMKAFAANIKGVEFYLRIHLLSNPMDRSTRYHSFELFAKDSSGGISHFQGWLDTGDPKVDRIPYQDKSLGKAGEDNGHRPVVWAATKHACEVDHTWCQELWTTTSWSWGPDINWAINDPTTYFNPGETYDPDPSHWQKTGKLGINRSMSISIFRNLEVLKKRGQDKVLSGDLWATQFGEVVSGPNDAKCQAKTEKYGTLYQNVCLENFIAPSLPQVTRTGNTVTKEFASTGVSLPN